MNKRQQDVRIFTPSGRGPYDFLPSLLQANMQISHMSGDLARAPHPSCTVGPTAPLSGGRECHPLILHVETNLKTTGPFSLDYRVSVWRVCLMAHCGQGFAFWCASSNVKIPQRLPDAGLSRFPSIFLLSHSLNKRNYLRRGKGLRPLSGSLWGFLS